MIYARAVIRDQLAGPQFVGGKTQQIGTSTTTVSFSGLTGGIDTEPRANDMIIIGVLDQFGGGEISPGAWVLDKKTADGFLTVYHRKEAYPVASVNVPSAINSDASKLAIVSVWRGVGSVSASAAANGTNTSVVSPPSVTIPSGGVGLVIGGAGAWPTAPPGWGVNSGMENRIEALSDYVYVQIGAGSSKTSPFPAWSGPTGSGLRWSAVSLALSPA